MTHQATPAAPTWYERIALARSMAVVRLLRGEAPVASAGLAALLAAQVTAEVGILVLLGLAIAEIVSPTSTQVTVSQSLIFTLVGITALYVIRHLTGPFVTALASSLDKRVRTRAGIRLVRIALATPLAELEAPAAADEFERVRGVSLEAGFKPRVISLFTDALIHRARLAGIALVLAWFSWWAPILFLSGAILFYGWARREVMTYLRGHGLATETFRRAGYFFDLALDRAPAKEIRLFGLGPWLSDRFTEWQGRGLGQIRVLRTGTTNLLLTASVASLSIGTVFFAILLGALQGDVGLGSAALFLAAVLTGAATILSGEGWVWGLAAAPLERLGRLEHGRAVPSAKAEHTANKLAAEVRIESLAFRYPNGRSVLRDLSVVFQAGQSAAIVGHNGAGKTTLVKLLCGLYQPSAGTVWVDGHDLAEVDAESWRRQIAVVFQDFVRYPLSARDNVAVGRGVEGNEARLWDCARRAEAGDLIAGLPDGWDTLLSPAYPGGIELSGGQWQRLALARGIAAIDAGARLLILDEPTASLDAEAEAEFNERLVTIASGITTILISHRFPTVRRADRIFVLHDGCVAESGSHADLMARDGLYARMFQLQARRFQVDAHD